MQGWGQKLLKIAVTASLALGLVSCTSAQFDAIPHAVGGLPENAPRRPDQAPEFPAVHNMPPARSSALLDEEQQKKLEADLIATRNRHPNQQKNRAKAKKAQAPAPQPSTAAPARPAAGAFPVPFGSPTGDGNLLTGR